MQTLFIRGPPRSSLQATGIVRQFVTSVHNNRRKAVIIGGSGFVGKYVAKTLVNDSNTEVQICARHPNINDLKTLGNQILSPISCDITSQSDISNACKDANIVVNLVGIMHEKPPKYTFENVQHQGAKKIAIAARENEAQLVHISAIGADPNSNIPYAKTKGLGEIAVREEYPDAIIIRPSLIFGPEDDFFNRFAKLARYLPFMPVFGGGNTKFQPIHVWDLAKAITQAAKDRNLRGKTIEAGGPTVYTYRELISLTLSQAGIKRPIISLPWFVGTVQGFFLEKLPVNLFTITRDQVRLLRKDNIVSSSSDVLTLQDMGIDPRPAEQILHQYLRQRDRATSNKRTHRMVDRDTMEEMAEIEKIRKQMPKKGLELEEKYRKIQEQQVIKR
ncbi:4391_t:CDS:2 [Paraglomus occultum]|uniref:4391_t:CDS:1 n=1 Tax=Paraglomus occultum TaxID=144539 RepID=A0A9N8VKH4_9GLOM|nr:4391_t:CDS:2 [Paraglomus occultum]